VQAWVLLSTGFDKGQLSSLCVDDLYCTMFHTITSLHVTKILEPLSEYCLVNLDQGWPTNQDQLKVVDIVPEEYPIAYVGLLKA
jgi:hypothetical protein